MQDKAETNLGCSHRGDILLEGSNDPERSSRGFRIVPIHTLWVTYSEVEEL